MSARDDYPLHRALEMLNGGPSALDEIDALRTDVVKLLARLHKAEAILRLASASDASLWTVTAP